MPDLLIGQRRLRYLLEGADARLPVLLLSNSLGTDLHMWDELVPGLLEHFRVLRYDTRGHGLSDAVAGGYTLAMLGGDALALMDALGIGVAVFCGISLGGMTGQWLAVHARERLLGLVLTNTAAVIGTGDGWKARIDAVLSDGTGSLAEGLMGRWFTPEFGAARPEVLRRMVDGLAKTSVQGYCGCCAALRDADMTGALAEIEVPVLVVTGDDDPVTTTAEGMALARGIEGAGYRQLRGRHLAPLENVREFNDALIGLGMREECDER